MLTRMVDAYHVRLGDSGEISNFFDTQLRLNVLDIEALFDHLFLWKLL